MRIDSEVDATTEADARRRHREWELDLLLAHELATASPAAARMWRSVGEEPPPAPVDVTPQAIRDDCRTTDLEARAADGRALLCENKAAGGSYEHRQPDSYAEHCAGKQAWAITVAPRAFLEHGASPLFHGHVAVEDLAAALDSAADGLTAGDAATTETRHSYRYRAEVLRSYARDPGYVGNPDDHVRQVGDQYRALLRSLTGGAFQLTSEAFKNRSTDFATLNGGSVGRSRLMHKLGPGKSAVGEWTIAARDGRSAP